MFQVSLEAHMKRAKPEEKITEVVDDMVDAVAGAEPKVTFIPSVWLRNFISLKTQLRYVPAMDVQMRSRVLTSMPVEMQDHVLNQ